MPKTQDDSEQYNSNIYSSRYCELLPMAAVENDSAYIPDLIDEIISGLAWFG